MVIGFYHDYHDINRLNLSQYIYFYLFIYTYLSIINITYRGILNVFKDFAFCVFLVLLVFLNSRLNECNTF